MKKYLSCSNLEENSGIVNGGCEVSEARLASMA